eukprot:CAMPEP_0170187102 /NCGR_PEP_ID=MMETSP0040_2-20121228/40913_1 /TAXON_ID=641309 /ORGANISM="Lotharella oceanica, Strain CCMP622" /LENGTH=38 /DNA_ID= /DNA_START= /DNA_END= /DNA_ORIENTATION=
MATCDFALSQVVPLTDVSQCMAWRRERGSRTTRAGSFR